jgi:cytochrome c-type biogenesis protein CcmE
MTPRQRRMILVASIVVVAGAGAAMLLRAFQENIVFSVLPSEVIADPKMADRNLRLGGMVKEGSLQRVAPGSMTINFVVTDLEHEIPVTYTGVTPDLFREGQGVFAEGKLKNGTLQAETILAKHDENYMPAEMMEKIKKEHGGKIPVAKPKE